MEFILDKNEFDLQLEKLEKLYKDTENFPEWHRELKVLYDWLTKSEKQFSAFLSALDKSMIIAVTEVNGRIIYVNDLFCKISKYRKDELIGKTHRVVRSGYHDKLFFKNMWDTILQGNIWEGNIKNRAKDGTYYWVNSVIIPLLDKNKKPKLFLSFRKDITKTKELEDRLLNELRKDYNLVLKTMHNYIFQVLKDDYGEFYFQFGEGKLGHDLGLNTDNVLDRSLQEVFGEKTAKKLEEKFQLAFKGETITFTFSFQDRYLLTTLTPVFENGDIISIIGNTNDISELYKANQEIEYLAYHDTLTGLPNRRKFKEHITRYFNKGTPFALFILDLDEFKRINDYLGHNLGDQLLRMVSNRLEKLVIQELKGHIYRYSGDEFIILLPEQTDEQQISHYANLILHSFKDKFHITDTMDVYVTISMGISLYPKHGKDEDSLIKSADRAMYASKRFEKNAYRIYDSELERVHKKSRQIENALKEVNMDEEFEVHFQPKMDIKTNEICGFEALVRWNHPELGNIPPNEFIKIAEETGNIWKIDEWVLREACKTVQTWNRRRKGKPFYIAVNISANHFAHPDFVPHVQSVLEKTGLDANLLEIEITETTLITNPEETKNNIQRLREIGVTVSIDDFGTGYTSLNYIRNYTFDTIKIDRSFIREMIEKKEDWIIVKTIINLAHELKIKVVAEGVEDEQVLQVLKELNCDEIQGYLISKPLSKGNLENSLNVWRKNNKCSKKQKRGS